MININTKTYWDRRFSSGDWELKKGRKQTTLFALSQAAILDIPKDFCGSILDFGCGLGDAIPIYKKNFPKAKLIGLDISGEAIKKCRDKFGDIAQFICGDYTSVPEVDIIISSNVFEHLSNDKIIAEYLLNKCKILNIIVPYKENMNKNLFSEHINFYDENYFIGLGNYTYKIFRSKGWGLHGFSLLYQGYFKNIFRFLLKKEIYKKQYQILFRFVN